jgi:hypothetical protein
MIMSANMPTIRTGGAQIGEPKINSKITERKKVNRIPKKVVGSKSAVGFAGFFTAELRDVDGARTSGERRNRHRLAVIIGSRRCDGKTHYTAHGPDWVI